MPTKFAMRLLAGTAVSALLTGASFAADAEARPFDIPQQDAATALQAFAMQSGRQVLFPYEAAKGKQAPEVKGDYADEEVIALLAASAGLKVTADDGRTVTLRPQFAQAAEAGGGSEVEALIVTAQKREEDIQDVPIAISAFTQEQLERSQVAGGPDLMTQVPNFTFTKTNFSSYSIQIRGIGTQAISATTDPAVAIAFNNTPFIRNRFFEQEFYDLQRVEVLRGPQGTLYGRNATAGVVNVISNKPKFAYEAKLSGDVSNYNSSRLEGMINLPLVEDVVAMRLAGAWTKREGYVTNEITGNPIDGRDLWSTRLSLRFTPTDALDVNLIWEHFEEDDDRLRSGKQLCKRHLPATIGGLQVNWGSSGPGGNNGLLYDEYFSQGCEAASLYSPDSFQAPNGLRLPYYRPIGRIGVPTVNSAGGQAFDPYASTSQSHDLRVIESTVDPEYAAETNIVELQVGWDFSDSLTLTSETAYLSDELFSTQDYNRFNTRQGAWQVTDGGAPQLLLNGILRINEDGYPEFCDPQVGCADRLVAVDLSTAKSSQFSQELRLSSNYEGPFNFSLGANFLRYDTEEKYYVFINSLSMYAAIVGANATGNDYEVGVTDNRACLPEGMAPPDPNTALGIGPCVYMDPNSIHSLNDLGHNYFLSRNPYKLISYAVFGETYYNLADNLKVTAGLRWTVDKKEAPRIPSWVLGANTAGYPVAEVIEQEWREPTGRLTLDWKPDLGFTDETLLYASYAHGYKAGGANPPASGLVFRGVNVAWELLAAQQAAVAPRRFDPEFVEAFEVGAKNTLFDGRMTLNAAAFYYDYQGYQISQIVNRAAINLNFDAKVWGLEIEADWRPLENLRFGFKGGYENTRMADGSRAVDTMDRTAGNPDWYVTAPFPTLPANCILPTYTVTHPGGVLAMLGYQGGGLLGPCELAYVLGLDPATAQQYIANPPVSPFSYAGYPGFDPFTAPNGGAGFYKDLSGNELPNAPNYTATITADYTVPLPNDWLATLHTDLYYQSEAWTRVFNTEGYDKLKAYTNVNLAAIFTNEDAGWKVMAYVKNVFDRDSITGAFLNSDDTGLTTNVFLTEPRLYGLRVTKEFSGGPWWTGADPNSTGPFPLTVELSGQVQRQDAPYEALTASWMGGLPADLVPENTQNRDLDWGDGRSLKLTWQPQDASWSVGAGVRYGRTNTQTLRTNELTKEIFHSCIWADADPRSKYVCDPDRLFYGNSYYYSAFTNVQVSSWSDAEARDHEEHLMVDFGVGLDVGIGLEESTVGAGLRYAEFESQTRWATNAQAGWNVPDGWDYSAIAKYYVPSSVTRYRTHLSAERDFSGTGPVLTWDAAVRLLGTEETGLLKLDWVVTGGALFGDRETRITGENLTQFHLGPLGASEPGQNELGQAITVVIGVPPPAGDPDILSVAISRSDDATVPLLDLALGLSYDVGRIKVGAGYRWERYFDVLDVGYGEAKDGDRTVDGPYFKLSVGFGG